MLIQNSNHFLPISHRVPILFVISAQQTWKKVQRNIIQQTICMKNSYSPIEIPISRRGVSKLKHRREFFVIFSMIFTRYRGDFRVERRGVPGTNTTFVLLCCTTRDNGHRLHLWTRSIPPWPPARLRPGENAAPRALPVPGRRQVQTPPPHQTASRSHHFLHLLLPREPLRCRRFPPRLPPPRPVPSRGVYSHPVPPPRGLRRRR